MARRIESGGFAGSINKDNFSDFKRAERRAKKWRRRNNLDPISPSQQELHSEVPHEPASTFTVDKNGALKFEG